MKNRCSATCRDFNTYFPHGMRFVKGEYNVIFIRGFMHNTCVGTKDIGCFYLAARITEASVGLCCYFLCNLVQFRKAGE